MTVELENDDTGETREVSVRSAGTVRCPKCESENVDFHNLNRVLAGECGTCFHVWRIGVDTPWSVVE